MRAVILLGAVVAVSAGACTLLNPLGGYAGAPADGGAASEPDAPGDASALFDGASSDSGDAGAASAYRAVVMSDLPVAYYRLGDPGAVAKDETGAHPGKVVGIIAHGPGAIAGDPDGAFAFSGQGWIDIASIYPFAGNASYSIEAWVAPMPATTLTGVLSRNLAKPGSTPSDGYSLYLDTTGVPSLGRWVSTNEDSVSAPSLEAGRFTHVVGTYDGATLRVYLNGTIAGSAASTQSLISPPADLAIGATRNGTFGYFVGSLDEVALYDKALSAERIAAHHVAGAPP